MTAFTITATTDASAVDAFAGVANFAEHRAPLTRIETDPGPPRLGWEVRARTGVGRVGFTDHMIVTMWQPPTVEGSPGAFRVVKIGSWLAGWAQVTVEQTAKGARVSWTEELHPRLDPVPRLTGPLSAALGRRLFARVLRNLLTGLA